MKKEIVHSIILIITIILAYIYPKTNLVSYELQITAFLFIVLYLSRRFIINNTQSSRLIESVIFTFIIVSIIEATGSLKSSFFFLSYFLIFSLSLLLEPIIAVTTTLTLIIIYLLDLPVGQNFSEIIPIISLAFITPFALFLGQQYLKNEKLKAKNAAIKEDTLLFLTLVIKNHLKTIKEAVDNFLGDHQLEIIKKATIRIEKLIDKYEKSTS